jgi:ubiquinone/menaquinone biosynthesis C-methylase UbiE
VNQCQKPTGWLGRFVLWNMNSRHSKVTDCGLSNIEVQRQDVILDVGCGGGRTVSKLAAMASEGRVYGIDFSRTSVAVRNSSAMTSEASSDVGLFSSSLSMSALPLTGFNRVNASSSGRVKHSLIWRGRQG